MPSQEDSQNASRPGLSLFIWPAALVIVLLLISMMVLLLSVKGTVDQFEMTSRYRPPLVTGIDLQKKAIAKQQLIYVPLYSHVYIRNGEPFRLTSTLSIRNTDLSQPLFVNSVRYNDSTGRLVRQFVEQAIEIAPLATIEFLVEERDTQGGSGASFVVDWSSENALTQPVVEAVMIGAKNQQGISFVCRGTVIAESRTGRIDVANPDGS